MPEEEIEIAAAYLSGTLLQRRTGVGWRGLAELPPPAAAASLSLGEVDAALEAISVLAGAGSGTARRTAVAELFGALTAEEQQYLRAVMTGQVRQGALDSVMLDADARGVSVPIEILRDRVAEGRETVAIEIVDVDIWSHRGAQTVLTRLSGGPGADRESDLDGPAGREADLIPDRELVITIDDNLIS